ncbi:MAG: hypothetical protein ACW98D_18450 [Promethearchaeota archaeon]
MFQNELNIIKNFINNFFFGITLSQEYICLSEEDLSYPNKVFLPEKDGNLKEITSTHLFLGYKPLIIGITNSVSELREKTIQLLFGPSAKEILGEIELELIDSNEFSQPQLQLFRGMKGINSLLNKHHQLLNIIRYKLTANKKNNLYLEGNLYIQVKVAYSVPRKIYLISLGDGKLFNIFPTDISGNINNKFFIVSLRDDRMANEQLKRLNQISIFEMDSKYYKEVYSLGINHTRDLMPLSSFRVDENKTQIYKLPIPKGAIKYYELEFIKSKKTGIHDLHFFSILNSIKLISNCKTLCHIHRDYAEWRIKRKLETGFLLR